MKRLKELRKKRGLTQVQLARYMNVADSTLSYWERGEFDPDRESLIKLADYFGVSVDFLLGRTDRPQGGSPPELTEDDILFALYDGKVENLPDGAYDDIKRFARFVIAKEQEPAR
jgi:transcriptional regulator with XRE-family HTH domain